MRLVELVELVRRAQRGAQFQARLNLAKCFRAHGINVPDPSPGGGPAGGRRASAEYCASTPSPGQRRASGLPQYFAKAFPRFNLTPAQRAQVQQQLVKFAECMRSHGVNVPDPTFNGSGSGRGFGFGGRFRSIDRNSPAFQSALKACQSLRPRFGRGAGGRRSRQRRRGRRLRRWRRWRRWLSGCALAGSLAAAGAVAALAWSPG